MINAFSSFDFDGCFLFLDSICRQCEYLLYLDYFFASNYFFNFVLQLQRK